MSRPRAEELDNVAGGNIYPKNDLAHAIQGRVCNVCFKKICICKR